MTSLKSCSKKWVLRSDLTEVTDSASLIPSWNTTTSILIAIGQIHRLTPIFLLKVIVATQALKQSSIGRPLNSRESLWVECLLCNNVTNVTYCL